MLQRLLASILGIICFLGETTLAATYFSPKIGYSIYSLNPVLEEKTPNYYGYFGQVSCGISLLKSLNFGLLVNYTPGSYRKAKIDSQDTGLLNYGGSLGVQVEETLSLTVQALKSHYQHISEHHDDALKGRWQGLGLGVGLGMLFKASRSDYVQLEVNMQRSWLAAEDDIAKANQTSMRRLSVFSIGFAYIFSDFHSVITETKLFKGLI